RPAYDAAELETIAIDSDGRESSADPLARSGAPKAGRDEQEPRVADPSEDLGPEGDHLGVELRYVVEARERHPPSLERWQRPDRRCIERRVIADVAVRHSQDCLCEILLGADWDLVTIGEQVIHRFQSGRPDIADPANLDRCRPPREDQKPMVGR